MSDPVTFSQARQGFRFYVQTANRAQLTIDWYDERLAQFEAFLLSKCSGQPLLLAGIEPNSIRGFIASLQNREIVYETHEYRSPISRKLSPFTVHGYVRTLAAFFHWAKREYLLRRNPMENIPRPKLPKSIKPRFEKQDLERLLKACSEYPEHLAARNRAIVLLLLDTGLRASELCRLTLYRLDPELRRAHVTGKGMKDRYVPIGARARKVLWDYINFHRKPKVPTDVVFLTRHDKPLNGESLAHVLAKLGDRAGVKNCHPHRFRHTSARLYLRNGGDVMTLQQILGHEDLSTTRIYIQLEREDVEKTHERASPVDRMGL